MVIFVGLAAKARSQSPYVPIQAREEFEKRLHQDEPHRGRSVSRSNSMRKRDSSWDKKWVDQVRRNKEEDGIGGGEGGMKRESSPRKLNNGVMFWEEYSRKNFRLIFLYLFLISKNILNDNFQ